MFCQTICATSSRHDEILKILMNSESRYKYITSVIPMIITMDSRPREMLTEFICSFVNLHLLEKLIYRSTGFLLAIVFSSLLELGISPILYHLS